MAVNTRRVKSVEDSIRDTDEPEHRLKKNLSGLDLTVFGVGVIIGTGIFVLTGIVARDQAGPAVAISFVIAGVVCGLAAICYAEFASTVPVAGSAYTFSYATFGEFIAWIIGWDLVLELALGAATVAVGWSGYLNQLLDDIGTPLPSSIAGETATVNIPAILIVLLMTGVLILGIKLSSRVTTVIVGIKLVVVLIVIVVGFFYTKAANYTPFVPPAQPRAAGEEGWLHTPLISVLTGFSPGTFGWGGVLAGAAIVFFAFIGFDIVATAAEETRNPKRDMPRGIIGSLVICTLLYVAVSLVVVGMQPYSELSTEAPLAEGSAARARSAAAVGVVHHDAERHPDDEAQPGVGGQVGHEPQRGQCRDDRQDRHPRHPEGTVQVRSRAPQHPDADRHEEEGEQRADVHQLREGGERDEPGEQRDDDAGGDGDLVRRAVPRVDLGQAGREQVVAAHREQHP